MIKIENDCVGPCPQGCINCGRKHVPHYYCDACGEETDPDELHENSVSGGHICIHCITDLYPKIRV